MDEIAVNGRSQKRRVNRMVSIPFEAFHDSSRTVRSNTTSTSLGSIQPYCNYSSKTNQSPDSIIIWYLFVKPSKLSRCGE